MNEVLQTPFVFGKTRLRSNDDPRHGRNLTAHQSEVEAVLRWAWLPVASLTDLAHTNAVVAVDVPPLKTSLVVARGPDDQIRAFHNACRHCGARLVKDGRSDQGAATSCACRGRTLAADGRLTGIADPTLPEKFESLQHVLTPVHADVWEGHVFVNLDTRPRQSLQEWLGRIHDEYSGAFADRQRIAAYRMDVSANWTEAINWFSGGEHAADAGKTAAPDNRADRGNLLRRRSAVEFAGRHRRHSAPAGPDRGRTPVETIAFERGRELYPAFPGSHPDPLSLSARVKDRRHRDGGFDVIEIFPVLVIFAAAHWNADLWFWPAGENRTDVRIDLFAYPAETIADHLAHACFRSRLREAFRAELDALEQVAAARSPEAMQDLAVSMREMLRQVGGAADAMIDPSAVNQAEEQCP